MEDLKITLIQSALHWENPAANLAMFEEKIWKIGGKTDLILLPEMFSTGFTMNAKPLAEPMNSTTTRWMKQQAAQTGAVICGSFIVREKETYFNRLVWMEPDGSCHYYDKRHLFRMAGEHGTYSQGKTRLTRELKGWKVFPLVCYDLRFPAWSRRLPAKGLDYDLLLYVANWPEKRSLAWNTLLRARALENQSYVAGVNRTGTDGNGHVYAGDSCVFGPAGEELLHRHNEELIDTVTLSAGELTAFRERFPAHLDADDFEISL